MRRCFLVVSMVGVAMVSANNAFGQESVEAAIRERVKEYETAYNGGDAEALGAIYAVDGTHTYALGFTHRGRTEITNGLREQFAGPLKGTSMTIKPLHIREVGPGVAVEEAEFTMRGVRSPAGEEVPPFDGLCLVVYVQRGAEWFVAAAQCMVPPPQ